MPMGMAVFDNDDVLSQDPSTSRKITLPFLGATYAFWITNSFAYLDLFIVVLTTLTLSRCFRNLREAFIEDHEVSSRISCDARFASQPGSSLATVPHTVDRELEEP
ncbi:uncharacterized protein FIBRA_07453 [Fibroporia radiculosa]|uniref:Uncharacterized protein n=1 Tax=Fibroporia radiculosa TaxID=599839 RepID=J4GEH5_9APHY|nr:uncharacterized protein FIBRA_07453 [Fibroporia radiculosa]CCM05243.1 predicted protein [Fibroporia radiculosa]